MKWKKNVEVLENEEEEDDEIKIINKYCYKEYKDDDSLELNNDIITPHSVKRVTIPIVLGKKIKNNNLEYAPVNGNSDFKFYYDLDKWNEFLKREKILYPLFSNFPITLKTNDTLYVASFSLMHTLKDNSYAFGGCRNNNSCIKNICQEGYGCINNKCSKCTNYTCGSCNNNAGKCTQCFSISKNGQWNVLDSNTNLKCDLNFVDITKFSSK